jgi:hypothetical protein
MSEKMKSIIAWKVAGELHIPKNITVGSNNPRFVLNAAFHWSSVFILTLLYPHLTSNLVKNLAPLILSMISEISGRGYAFLTVQLLDFRTLRLNVQQSVLECCCLRRFARSGGRNFVYQVYDYKV